jgi:uncharacterized protein (TIGR02117 family)
MILRVLMVCVLVLASRAATAAEWACTAEGPSCKLVLVAHDSWHAGIVLRKADIPIDSLPELADFPDAEFVEFSWGDKDYFPDSDAGVFTAIKAAFWSSGSVLHVVGFSGNPKSFFRSGELVALRLTPNAHARLLDYISHTFSRPSSRDRTEASAGLFSYSRFYPATHKFSLLKTCNTWVAEALKSAGLPVSPGHVMTANSLATQLAGIEGRE